MYFRKLSFFAISLAMLTFFSAPGNKLAIAPAYAGPQCTCRFNGADIAEGQTACLKTSKGMMLARCERVLNNTSWKMLGTPCPFSQRAPIDQPIMTASTNKSKLSAGIFSIFENQLIKNHR